MLVFLAIVQRPAQAVQLFTLAGNPVGGHWQRWANEARVPTVRRLTLDVSATDAQEFCGNAGACSMGWQKSQARITIAAPNADRSSFYYELGHQFDWRFLTNADRRFLAREWGTPKAHWLDSQASVAHGAEDGLEAVFPDIYADCAVGVSDKGQDIAVGFINSRYAPPGVTPKVDTCAWLTRIGLRRHASVTRWKHWNYIPAADVPTPTTTIVG